MTEIKPDPAAQVLASQEPRRTVPALVENLFAPEVFASEASFFTVGPGVVTITFASYRWDNSTTPGIQKRVVTGRLVMPISGAQSLAAGLYDYLKKMDLDPVPLPPDPQQIQ